MSAPHRPAIEPSFPAPDGAAAPSRAPTVASRRAAAAIAAGAALLGASLALAVAGRLAGDDGASAPAGLPPAASRGLPSRSPDLDDAAMARATATAAPCWAAWRAALPC